LKSNVSIDRVMTAYLSHQCRLSTEQSMFCNCRRKK